jgi:hypothetical protein
MMTFEISPEGRKYKVTLTGRKRYLCSEDGCLRVCQIKDKCIPHGGTYKKCAYKNCTKQSRGGLLFCAKHNPTTKLCVTAGCKNKVISNRGYCWSHRPNAKQCSENGCSTLAKRYGKCYKHGGVYKNSLCNSAGCSNGAHIGGKCMKHSSNERHSKYRTKTNIYVRNKRRTDVLFRLTSNLRGRINRFVRRRDGRSSTRELIGCSPQKLKVYLEALFLPGMSWDNYGSGDTCWHIDHIIPCCSFNLMDPDDQKRCFNYTNLQPLWARDNMKKHNKVPKGIELEFVM